MKGEKGGGGVQNERCCRSIRMNALALSPWTTVTDLHTMHRREKTDHADNIRM